MTKIGKDNFLKAWDNKRLVAGALKMAHVRPDFAYYEDYLQEGVCIYAEMLEKNPQMERKKLDNLAFNRIIWRTLDDLRKVKLRSENSTPIDDAFTLASKDCNWEMLLDLEELAKTFNDYERMILFEHLLSQKRIVELVKVSGVSRQYLQRIKRNVLKKIQDDFVA